MSWTGFDTLLTRDITKSSADQRKGRAGREVSSVLFLPLPLFAKPFDTTHKGPGFCFRLYTEDSYIKMPISSEPEILRCSLTSSILDLKCLGQNLEELELMDQPDQESSKKVIFFLMVTPYLFLFFFGCSRFSSQDPLAPRRDRQYPITYLNWSQNGPLPPLASTCLRSPSFSNLPVHLRHAQHHLHSLCLVQTISRRQRAAREH